MKPNLRPASPIPAAHSNLDDSEQYNEVEFMSTSDSDDSSQCEDKEESKETVQNDQSDMRFRALFAELYDVFDRKADEVERTRSSMRGLIDSLKLLSCDEPQSSNANLEPGTSMSDTELVEKLCEKLKSQNLDLRKENERLEAKIASIEKTFESVLAAKFLDKVDGLADVDTKTKLCNILLERDEVEAENTRQKKKIKELRTENSNLKMKVENAGNHAETINELWGTICDKNIKLAKLETEAEEHKKMIQELCDTNSTLEVEVSLLSQELQAIPNSSQAPLRPPEPIGTTQQDKYVQTMAPPLYPPGSTAFSNSDSNFQANNDAFDFAQFEQQALLNQQANWTPPNESVEFYDCQDFLGQENRDKKQEVPGFFDDTKRETQKKTESVMSTRKRSRKPVKGLEGMVKEIRKPVRGLERMVKEMEGDLEVEHILMCCVCNKPNRDPSTKNVYVCKPCNESGIFNIEDDEDLPGPSNYKESLESAFDGWKDAGNTVVDTTLKQYFIVNNKSNDINDSVDSIDVLVKENRKSKVAPPNKNCSDLAVTNIANSFDPSNNQVKESWTLSMISSRPVSRRKCPEYEHIDDSKYKHMFSSFVPPPRKEGDKVFRERKPRSTFKFPPISFHHVEPKAPEEPKPYISPNGFKFDFWSTPTPPASTSTSNPMFSQVNKSTDPDLGQQVEAFFKVLSKDKSNVEESRDSLSPPPTEDFNNGSFEVDEALNETTSNNEAEQKEESNTDYSSHTGSMLSTTDKQLQDIVTTEFSDLSTNTSDDVPAIEAPVSPVSINDYKDDDLETAIGSGSKDGFEGVLVVDENEDALMTAEEASSSSDTDGDKSSCSSSWDQVSDISEKDTSG